MVVRSDCDDGIERRLTGAGSHTVEVDVGSAGEPAGCAVEFEPRGPLIGCGTDCPVFLEQATFRAGSGRATGS